MVIGSRVVISALVATTIDKNIGLRGYDESIIAGPIIEDDAAIGAGATILPGVRICAGSIVGAGAVVTKDVPPKTLVIGIPARVVRDLDKLSETCRSSGYLLYRSAESLS